MTERSGRLIIIGLALVIILMLLATTCSPNDFITSQGDTITTLHKAGFENVKLGGINFTKCGFTEKRGRDFSATNPAGGISTGTVCCGFSPIFGFNRACSVKY